MKSWCCRSGPQASPSRTIPVRSSSKASWPAERPSCFVFQATGSHLRRRVVGLLVSSDYSPVGHVSDVSRRKSSKKTFSVASGALGPSSTCTRLNTTRRGRRPGHPPPRRRGRRPGDQPARVNVGGCLLATYLSELVTSSATCGEQEWN